MISLLILTKNEEQDLPGCLESVKWCDDIHVFDSFSTDNTLKIASEHGAIVTQRNFDNYSAHRNAALDTIHFKYPWIFILDADERLTAELVFEMKNEVSLAKENVNGFRIRRRDYLGDKWLKHAQISPYYIRLIRKGTAYYHREINEVLEVSGEIKSLNGFFNHYPFSKGLKQWLDKHNRYSSMEAQRWIDEHDGKVKFSLKRALFSKDFSERRYHQKGLFYKLPGRPFLKWMYMVFWRCSFLDGRAGITYATLQSVYEYFIVLKTKDLINKKKSTSTL
ncbi:MAG: glycosyltransferase family 2 protein [Bacteroidetes bacterium]|nr:glycosyltransferase family 2 protein [Bacteroidota bacterium]MBS1745784.1 glycosyltransferase family 2 protein [Bacteroidota bacterium]